MIGFTCQTYIVPASARKNILFPGFLLVTAFYQKLHEKKNIVNSSKAGEKISMFRCHQVVTRGAFSGVTLIMRLRLPTVGWVVQQSANNLPSAPYRVICDISIVNTKFLNEDDVHMIFLSLFLCSWSLSCECVTVLFSCRHGERAPGQRSHWSARFCPSRGLPERGCVSGKPKETLQFWVDLCEYKEYLKFVQISIRQTAVHTR